MLQRLFDAPFTNQLNHLSRAQALVAKIKEVRDRMHPRLFLETRATYEEALARSPRDWRLPENFAEFLEATGDLDAAVVQWRRVVSLLPHHHAAYFHAGRLLSRQKKYTEAKDYLLKALNLRPDLVDGRIELGQVLFNEGKPGEALGEYAQARTRRPEDVRVLVLMANALAAQGKRAEATASLREAIRLRPSYWEARYLLGVELAVTNQIAEALEQFKEVIRLRPDYAVAHFNLGVALAKQERLQDAAMEFQETLRLDPNHQLARKYLQGLELPVKPGP
jgi:superkiller protein 3